MVNKLFEPILTFYLIIFSSFITCSNGVIQANKVLNVGEELFKETLPLHSGSRYYQLKGLKPYTLYEVKISYPASIPAIFSLQLEKGNSDVGMNGLRKLLNTEKLIFKTESIDDVNNQGGMFVLVTVEPEGIVAIPGVQERESVLFNIVCDELVLGIPHKACFDRWLWFRGNICFGDLLKSKGVVLDYVLGIQESKSASFNKQSKDWRSDQVIRLRRQEADHLVHISGVCYLGCQFSEQINGISLTLGSF